MGLKDVREDAGPRQQEPEYPDIKEEVEDEQCPYIQEKEDEGHTHIKEEEEEHLRSKEDEGKPPYIKEEEKEYICKLLSTGIPLKSEDEGQSEPSRGPRPQSSRISSQHTTTKGDGGHCEGSQVNGVLVQGVPAIHPKSSGIGSSIPTALVRMSRLENGWMENGFVPGLSITFIFVSMWPN
ncbi:uncharacterized protein LOC109519151 isoform X2 [Hippocampus comes]|uniref:uncharacterized protein LOC109519151 isoform X2 n=1 Tax=Hippocampus comes TaxID=109280 RepID=UPI00094ECAE7|nr:PREDICTED: uncharacterized protein LOC109519151 isoform X2 [Hippocampus comes]